MKSSTGAHYLALDHVRALAVFMVFTWHFIHGTGGKPVPFEGAPAIFPLALLDEGHTGVALFMVLSGYLFAKLLDGKDISFVGFFWNRFIRLAPLLLVVFALVGAFTVRHGDPLDQYIKSLAIGFVAPRWPNGGWSIAVEIQFYLLLCFVLAATRRYQPAPIVAVVIMIAIRSLLFEQGADMRFYSYATMAGRADDFLLGIAAFNYRHLFRCRHLFAGVIAIAFCALVWLFDAAGGYYLMAPQWPWIVIPTIEAAGYATLIGYYDSSFQPVNAGLSKLVARIGIYSYSIYLLHFFIVFRAASFINDRVLDISNFYVACLASTVIFCGMIPIGWLSYRYIEGPALALRRPYLKLATRPAAQAA
jgi:peptidoglycan/LPS O-acetylase OafA/YrhL